MFTDASCPVALAIGVRGLGRELLAVRLSKLIRSLALAMCLLTFLGASSAYARRPNAPAHDPPGWGDVVRVTDCWGANLTKQTLILERDRGCDCLLGRLRPKAVPPLPLERMIERMLRVGDSVKPPPQMNVAITPFGRINTTITVDPLSGIAAP